MRAAHYCCLSLAVLLLAAVLALADDRAVVRIPSHGASATVIWSREGKSYLLGCAHAYDARGRAARHVIDVPSGQSGRASAGGVRLVAVDHRLDLSLLEVGAGPLPTMPVAPRGYRASRRLVSAGYDGMRWPATRAWADMLGTRGTRTFTRQSPTPGRSGGALIDPEDNYLVGVCLAFESNYPGGPGVRGVYASHEAILGFLAQQRWTLGHLGGAQQERWRRLELPADDVPAEGPACPPGGT